MLYGIGTDIIEITRIKNAKQSFLQKTFTEQELDYFYQKGIKPSKKLASLLEQMEIKAQFQLSLSHCQEYAVAFVILHQA